MQFVIPTSFYDHLNHYHHRSGYRTVKTVPLFCSYETINFRVSFFYDHIRPSPFFYIYPTKNSFKPINDLFIVAGICWVLGITDFTYPRPFVPKNERSLWRTFVPQERKFQEVSFPGPFVHGNFRSPGTKWNFRSPGTFVPAERKMGTFVPGTFRTRELSFPLSDRPSRRFA